MSADPRPEPEAFPTFEPVADVAVPAVLGVNPQNDVGTAEAPEGE